MHTKANNKNKESIRGNFQRGNYTNIRDYLQYLKWNDLLKDKSVTECCEIIMDEIDCYYYMYSFQITKR